MANAAPAGPPADCLMNIAKGSPRGRASYTICTIRYLRRNQTACATRNWDRAMKKPRELRGFLLKW